MIFKNLISIIVGLFLLYTPVYAESDYGDIQLLIKQSQYTEALKLTEDQLSRNASDIKLKFMKGLILTRLERFAEAETVFTGLTRSNPELPEPFNNLAVIYAAQGKYTEAEEALQNAINTHPSYATAHENLGDIYAKMASRAYNQALELDTSNNAAREKLSLVNDLISAPPESDKEVIVKSNPKKSSAKSKPEIVAADKKQVKPEAISVPKPVASPAPKVDKTAEQEKNRKDVERAIKAWANAWSAQDVDSYLANYGKEFIPDKNRTRSHWEKLRRKRILKPAYIKINLSNIKINIHGKDYAEVKFTQQYLSDTYGDKVDKEVIMRKINDKWLIMQERAR